MVAALDVDAVETSGRAAGLRSVGVTMMTICITTVTVVIALHTRSWSIFHVVCYGLSVRLAPAPPPPAAARAAPPRARFTRGAWVNVWRQMLTKGLLAGRWGTGFSTRACSTHSRPASSVSVLSL